MKTIFFSALFLALQLNSVSQTTSDQTASVNKPEALQQARYSLIIETLPALSDPKAELSLELTAKGIYTFRKAESLVIPENYSLIIEDLATGNVFDLSSSERHAFSVNRAMIKSFLVRLVKINPATELSLIQTK